MSKANDTDFGPDPLRIVPEGKEGLPVEDTPEAEQLRKGKRAQWDAERRERSEEIFVRKRWTREEAIHWVAFRDKHSLERSIRGAVLYEQHPLVDREPRRSLVEAVTKAWISEFTDGRGEVWYESENVQAVFRDSGGSSPPPRRGKPNLPQTIADFLVAKLGNRRPSMSNPQLYEFLKNNARKEDGIQVPSEASIKRAIAKAWPEKRKSGRPKAK